MQAKKRLVTASNSDSSDSCNLHPMSSGEKDISDATTSDDKVYQVVAPPDSIKEGDSVLICFFGPKRKQHYIGKAVDVFNDGDIIFKFLRRLDHSNLLREQPFVFPENSKELFTYHMSDIVLKLPVPLNRKGTKRCQQKLIFPIYSSSYTIIRSRIGLLTRTNL